MTAQIMPGSIDAVIGPLGDEIMNVVKLVRSQGKRGVMVRTVQKEHIAVALVAILELVENRGSSESDGSSGKDDPTANQLPGGEEDLEGGEEKEHTYHEQTTSGMHHQTSQGERTKVIVSQSQLEMPRKSGRVCPNFRKAQCPHGFKGRECVDEHPRICNKFARRGRLRGGCSNKGCPLLHFRICNESYNGKKCFRVNCEWRHLKWLQRKDQAHPNIQKCHNRGAFASPKQNKSEMNHYNAENHDQARCLPPRQQRQQQQQQRQYHQCLPEAGHGWTYANAVSPPPVKGEPFLEASGNMEPVKELLKLLLNHLA